MRVKSTGLIPVRSTTWGISLVVKTIRRWFDSNILHKVNPLWVATMVVGTNWLPLERTEVPCFLTSHMDGCQSGLLSFFAKEMLLQNNHRFKSCTILHLFLGSSRSIWLS